LTAHQGGGGGLDGGITNDGDWYQPDELLAEVRGFDWVVDGIYPVASVLGDEDLVRRRIIEERVGGLLSFIGERGKGGWNLWRKEMLITYKERRRGANSTAKAEWLIYCRKESKCWCKLNILQYRQF
jgi:hypothetical protein